MTRRFGKALAAYHAAAAQRLGLFVSDYHRLTLILRARQPLTAG
ncbi:hypothetical protein [Longimycelium tulufanense]|nr:hypothetical protein [Longimycelium tulufanense]